MSIIIDNLGVLIMFFFLSLCFFIARGISNSNHASEKNKQSFWAQESKANMVRRQDISALPYISVHNHLPIEKITSIGRNDLVDEFNSLSKRKMLNLSGYTNTDLKLMYGPANLDELSNCDESFIRFIRVLNNMGTALLNTDIPDTENAKIFFEYAISIDSDISQTYISLATLYMKEENTDKIDQLIEKSKELKSLSASALTTKLNNIKLNVK